MIEELLQNPNKLFQISDDDEAKMCLLEFGLMGKFSAMTASRTQMITYGDHPTHFVVAMYFTGKTKNSDNGYLIYLLPKNTYPPDRAMEFVQKMAGMHDYAETVKLLADQSSDN